MNLFLGHFNSTLYYERGDDVCIEFSTRKPLFIKKNDTFICYSIDGEIVRNLNSWENRTFSCRISNFSLYVCLNNFQKSDVAVFSLHESVSNSLPVQSRSLKIAGNIYNVFPLC